MIDLLDLHAHTVASGYAYNSPYEMVHSASARRLSLFGCSDHTPTMPDSCHSFHFINFKILPRTLYGARLMMSMELNIMNCDGTVDLEQGVPELLGYTIASLYQPYIHGGAVLQNTNAYLGVLKNPLVHIIGYPDDSRFPMDCDTLVATVGEHHKLLEVNSSSLNPLSFRVGTRNNYIKMLELYRYYGTSIIINSGAHCEADAGSHAFAHALLEEVSLPRELIVNTSLGQLYCFLPKTAAIPTQWEGERCDHLYRPVTMGEGNAPGGDKS